MIEAELGSMATLPGIGVFHTELGANQVPLKLAPLAVLTATVVLWLAGVVPLAPLQVRVNVVVALSAPVLALPLVGSLPDHPPEAVQLVAFVEDQLNVEADPLLTVPGVAIRVTPGEVTATGPGGVTAAGPVEVLAATGGESPPPQPVSSPASAEKSRRPKTPPAR
jgi:hypothetical protein